MYGFWRSESTSFRLLSLVRALNIVLLLACTFMSVTLVLPCLWRYSRIWRVAAFSSSLIDIFVFFP